MDPLLLAQIAGSLSPFGASPKWGLISNLLGGFQNQQQWNRAEDEIRAGNEVGDTLVQNQLSGGGPPLTQQAANLGTQIIRLGNEYFDPAAAEGRFEEYLGGVVPGYQQLAARARSLVNQESGQEFNDIRTAGQRAEQQALSNLASRGLATSTVAPSVQGSIREQTTAELNRAHDARTGRLLDVEGTFGAAVPGAQFNVGQAGLQNYDLNAQNQIASLYQGGMLPINTGFDVNQQALNWYGPSRTIPIPPQYQPMSIYPPVR